MHRGFCLWVLVIVAAALLAAVEFHLPGVNGTVIWFWQWRRINPAIVYPICVIALLPAALAQFTRPSVALILLCLASAGFEISARAAEPNAPNSGIPGQTSLPTRVGYIQQDLLDTGFFTAAGHVFHKGESVANFLAEYPTLMRSFGTHPRIKPPGCILFYWPLLTICSGDDQAALAGGILIGLLALLGIPATYWMIKTLTSDSAAALQGAAYLSLCAGFVGFFPNFDQLFPILTAAMVVCWTKSLRVNRYRWSIAFGIVLALVLFVSYNLLVLGAFLLALAFVEHHSPGKIIKHAIVSLLVCCSIYLALWLATRFDPLATFRTALRIQRQVLPTYHRPWPQTIPSDLADFLLGMGWLSGILAIIYLLRPARRGLAIICLAQPILVAILGVLQCENARVWIFMMPLIMIPVGLELATWPKRSRAIVCICLGLIAAAILRNMQFFVN